MDIFYTSASGMNTYGFKSPDRSAWNHRARQILADVKLPLDLCMTIAEYGSSYTLVWRDIFVWCPRMVINVDTGLDSIVLPNQWMHDPSKVLFTCAVRHKTGRTGVEDIYIDMLPDGTWHRRLNLIDRPNTQVGAMHYRTPSSGELIFRADIF